MSQPGSPWGQETPEPAPPPAPSRGRPFFWLILLAALGGLVLALARAFPEAVRTGGDWASIGYGVGVVVLIAAGMGRLTRGAIAQHLRHAAIWLSVIAVLGLGFAYREELAGVPKKLQLAAGNGSPVVTGDHELVIPQNDEGGFVVVGKVNGQRVRFIVDTGATDIVLSPDDARRLGVAVDSLSFDGQAETANGIGRHAAWRADRIEVGPIAFDDVAMSVNQAPMSSSLLGLAFLDRLAAYEFRGRKLILKWRDPAG